MFPIQKFRGKKSQMKKRWRKENIIWWARKQKTIKGQSSPQNGYFENEFKNVMQDYLRKKREPFQRKWKSKKEHNYRCYRDKTHKIL